MAGIQIRNDQGLTQDNDNRDGRRKTKLGATEKTEQRGLGDGPDARERGKEGLGAYMFHEQMNSSITQDYRA